MTCHACRRYHDNICWPMKDALWTIVKSKELRDSKAQAWARAALGLGD